MNQRETLKIMAVIRAAYPYYYNNQSQEDLKTAVRLWQGLFEEHRYELVSAAVKAFIAGDKKGFPPTVGMIMDKLRLLTQRDEPTEMEAWSLVHKAVKNAAWYAEEEFDALPPDIRQIVASPASLREWAMMDSGTFQSVVQSNFMRSYRARRARAQEVNCLPKAVQKLIGTLSEKASLEDPEKKDQRSKGGQDHTQPE